MISCPSCGKGRWKPFANPSAAFDTKMNHYFNMMDAREIIKHIYNDDRLFSLLQESLPRRKHDPNVTDVDDSYGGLEYMDFVKEGKLGNINQVAVGCSIDGISPFNNSDYKIWLLVAFIHDFPLEHRFKPENMFIIGAWFSTEEPVGNTFLLPFIHCMNVLAVSGVYIRRLDCQVR
jgi:hypothetical protein